MSKYEPLIATQKINSVGQKFNVAFELPQGRNLLARLSRFRFRKLGLNRELARIISLKGVRILHAHFATDALSVVKLCHRNKVSLIVTVHGYDLPILHNRKDQPAWKYLIENTTMFIAVSSFVASRLISAGIPASKVKVCYIGIPVDRAMVPNSAHARANVVLFVGRLVEKKGVGDLLAALDSARLRLTSSYELWVVGDGPLMGDLRAMAKGLGIPTRFFGWQEATQVRRLMNQAAVFCAPSKTAADGDIEGLGMVFLEAQHSCMPVVAYDHGGVREAVESGSTGLLATEGDIVGLARALEQLLNDVMLRETFGDAGRARALTKFDIDERTSDLEYLYDCVWAGS